MKTLKPSILETSQKGPDARRPREHDRGVPSGYVEGGIERATQQMGLLQRFHVFICVLCLLILLPFMAQADPVVRKILTFYDRDEGEKIDFMNAHLYAEMPLNQLGLILDHRAVQDPLPTDEEMRDYRGIFIWFKDGRLKNPGSYCRWLSRQIRQGKKTVVFGNVGTEEMRDVSLPECLDVYQALDIKKVGGVLEDPYLIEFTNKTPFMVEFERKLRPEEISTLLNIRGTDPRKKVYLQARFRDRPDVMADMVFTHSKGGYVAPNYAVYFFPYERRFQWRLNPFAFFEEAFQVKGIPRPDLTTLNGRRIFYAHVDGDGLFNPSYGMDKRYAGQIILEEVLKKHPHIPITIGFISGNFDPKMRPKKMHFDIARKIANLPNVQLASHGYAHPLIWETKKLALDIPGYVQDEEREIHDSMEFIKKEIAPPDKDLNLFLWTGNCVPTLKAMEVVKKYHYLEMNGGDSRFDGRYDSYTGVFPVGIQRGPWRQIYSTGANEDVYTNLWTGPFYGFINVIDTFINTETPLRIKPVNLYYHFYIAEREAGLNSLKKIYDWVEEQRLIPMTASEYVAMAGDFYHVRMTPIEDGGWLVDQGPHTKTIRFDREARKVDLNRSQGVLGFYHHQGNLYVALEEQPSHKIYLTNTSPERPYLIEANGHIRRWRVNPDGVDFLVRGWQGVELVIGGLEASSRYHIEIQGEKFSLKTDGSGILHVKTEQIPPPEKEIFVGIKKG